MTIPKLMLAAVLAASIARADVVYDNVGGASAGTDAVSSFGPLFDSFSVTKPSKLSAVLLLLSGSSAPVGTLAVGLYADSSGLPGNLISSLATVPDTSMTSALTTYTIQVPTEPALAGGSRYWIGLSGDTFAQWSWTFDTSEPGVAAEWYSNMSGAYPNAGNGAYQMEVVTANPEPGSAALLAAGLAALVLWRFRLRNRAGAAASRQDVN